MEDVPVYKPRLHNRLNTVENSYVVQIGCVGVISAWILGDLKPGNEVCQLSPEEHAARLTKEFEKVNDLLTATEAQVSKENCYFYDSDSGSLLGEKKDSI